MTDFLGGSIMMWKSAKISRVCPYCGFGSWWNSWGKGNAVCCKCNQEFVVGTKDGKLVGLKLEEALTQTVPCDAEFVENYRKSISKKEEKKVSKQYWEAEEQGSKKAAEKTESEILGELQSNCLEDMTAPLVKSGTAKLDLSGGVYTLPPGVLVEKRTAKGPFAEGEEMDYAQGIKSESMVGETCSNPRPFSLTGRLDRHSISFSRRKEILHFAEKMAEEISSRVKPHELHLFQVFVNNLLEKE